MIISSFDLGGDRLRSGCAPRLDPPRHQGKAMRTDDVAAMEKVLADADESPKTEHTPAIMTLGFEAILAASTEVR